MTARSSLLRARMGRFSIAFVALVVVGCGSRTPLIVDEVSDGGADTFAADSGHPIDARSDTADTTPSDLGVDVPTTACPTDVPGNGATCSVAGAVCTYGSTEIGPCGKGTWQIAARCEPDGWFQVARCIDKSACPDAAPAEHSACSEIGLDCFYSRATSCAGDAVVQCTSGGWRQVNDCGRTLAGAPCHLATTWPAAQTLFSSSGTIVDRAALHAVGTQIVTSYVLTPELGGSESIDRARFQSAVPNMAAPLSFSPFGPYRGDTTPALAYSSERLGIAWGSSEASLTGAFVAVGGFDDTTLAGATRLDGRRTESADLALATIVSGDTHVTTGWVVFRHELTAGDTKSGASAVPIDALGNARGGVQSLVKERLDPPEPLIEPIHHAWAAVTRHDKGFVVAAPAPASGDFFDDSGVLLWFVDDPSATTLPDRSVRVRVGQTTSGSIAALSDGSIVLAYVLETPTPDASFELVKVTSDGTITHLSPPPLTPVTNPQEPHVAAFDDGFVVAWAGIAEAAPDFTPGIVTLSLRDANGAPIDSPIRIAANDLDVTRPISVTVSPTDRTVHTAWTVRAGTGTVSVARQRTICDLGFTD